MPAVSRRTRRYRGIEIPALFACAIWLLSYEAVPFAHAIEHARGVEHDHGDGHHRHDDDHGDGSLAHRGIAAMAPPPAIPPIDPPLVAIVRFETLAQHAVPGVSFEANARGPPRLEI
jgi:hypothetical protein